MKNFACILFYYIFVTNIITYQFQELGSTFINPTQPHWFVQSLTHQLKDNRTFNQKYYVNLEYYNQNSNNCILYIGGESALTVYSSILGFSNEIGKSLNAIIYSLEHRYYGDSIPFNRLNKFNLQYLSSENAIMDIIKFIQFVDNPVTNQPNPINSTRWILIGGSYAGNLVVWTKLRWPKLIWAGLASSAPIFVKRDFYEYDQAISKVLGSHCSSILSQISNRIDQVISISNTTQIDQLKSLFSCSDIKNDTLFLYTIIDIFSYTVQYSNIINAPSYEEFCEALSSINDTQQQLGFYGEYIKKALLSINTSCYRYSRLDELMGFDSKPHQSYRQWIYQCCKEFGYWQTSPSKSVSIRSNYLTVDWFENFMCNNLFFGKGVGSPNYISIQSDLLQNLPERVIWTNGDSDPWAYLSVNDSTYSTSLTPIYLIKGGSHVNDLGPSSPTDSIDLKMTRLNIIKNLLHWLNTID